MKKRSKPTLCIPTITSLEEADDALARIAARKREISLCELGLKEDADKLKAACVAACEPAKQDIATLELALARFAETRKAELFDKKKSLNMNFGIIGFRASSTLKTIKKFTWDNVLGFLSERDMDTCIRIKREVDKEALRQLAPEKLAEVGCKLVQEDVFFCEITETELADTDSAA